MAAAFFLGYLLACVVINGIFLAALIRDCWVNRSSIRQEPGNVIIWGIYCMVVQFLSAFGVSDFAIHLVFWRKGKVVPTKKLPGTMLCACIIPQTVMGIAYVTTIQVDFQTLVLSIVFSLAGALLGVQIVSKLDEHIIRRLICGALLFSSGLMILGLLELLPVGGTAMGLRSWKQALNCVICFVLSALSMAGFPITALKMSLSSSLGLSTKAAYPLASGTAALTIAFGGLSFIRHDGYSRKMTLISTITGSVGALIAVVCVKNLNTTVLRWGVAVLALYSGISMLREQCQEVRVSKAPNEHEKTAL